VRALVRHFGPLKLWSTSVKHAFGKIQRFLKGDFAPEFEDLLVPCYLKSENQGSGLIANDKIRSHYCFNNDNPEIQRNKRLLKVGEFTIESDYEPKHLNILRIGLSNDHENNLNFMIVVAVNFTAGELDFNAVFDLEEITCWPKFNAMFLDLLMSKSNAGGWKIKNLVKLTQFQDLKPNSSIENIKQYLKENVMERRIVSFSQSIYYSNPINFMYCYGDKADLDDNYECWYFDVSFDKKDGDQRVLRTWFYHYYAWLATIDGLVPYSIKNVLKKSSTGASFSASSSSASSSSASSSSASSSSASSSSASSSSASSSSASSSSASSSSASSSSSSSSSSASSSIKPTKTKVVKRGSNYISVKAEKLRNIRMEAEVHNEEEGDPNSLERKCNNPEKKEAGKRKHTELRGAELRGGLKVILNELIHWK
jgi:hypothetical protein